MSPAHFKAAFTWPTVAWRPGLLSKAALRSIISSLALTLVAAGVSSASTDSVLFPISQTTLSNGLQVFTVEERNSPLVAVQVWYHVGSADEPSGRHGFAHLFEHMMFRGTDRLGPTDHFDLIHSVGGSCNAFTSFDETCYHETLPVQQLELALWLESERMGFLTVDGPGFNTERKVVEEERRLDLNMPYGELADKGPPVVFGQHPYGHDPLGTFQDLRQATPADVHAWWNRHYTPNNATIIVAGDIDPLRVRELCDRYFGWIPPVPPPGKNIPILAAWDSPQQITFNVANAPAPGVGLIWRTVPEGAPDAPALELLAMILGGDPMTTIRGGGNSSRLYRRLVAEEHLAVMASAVQFGMSRAGLFGAGAALPPLLGNTTRSLSVLRSEIERLRSDGVTAEELEKARTQAISGLIREAQTVEGKASLVGRAAVVGAGVKELLSRLARLRALTLGDLKRAAEVHLDPAHAMAVTVPGAGLWDQISRLFFGNRQDEESAPLAFAPDTLLRGREGVTRPEGLPTRPPLSDSNPAVPQPSIQEYRLANGLRILVVPNPDKSVVEAVLVLPFGSWAERKPGAAAMALTMLPKATELHDEKALAEQLDRYAIRLSAVAGPDDSRIELSCLPEEADRALSLLAEVATRPIFPEGPFRLAVTRALTELRVVDTTPLLVAERELRRHLFPAHPYGRRVSGEEADIMALKTSDVKEFWRDIARPAQATLIISGGLTDKRARALAERCFADWRAVPQPDELRPAPPAPSRPAATQVFLVDWPGTDQSQICIGGLGIVHRDPDKPIASLMGSYFGGSFGSRLMKAIRVEKGATYGASGQFEPGRFAGSLVVQTFTKTASTADTVRTALAELRGLLERPPGAEELALHKRAFLGGAAARFETPAQVAAQLAHIALNGLPLDNFQRSLARIGAATPAECESFARRVVDPAHLIIVVVGDAASLSKELAFLGPVAVLDRTGKPMNQAATSPP